MCIIQLNTQAELFIRTLQYFDRLGDNFRAYVVTRQN
jgi:hypothetical protein